MHTHSQKAILLELKIEVPTAFVWVSIKNITTFFKIVLKWQVLKIIDDTLLRCGHILHSIENLELTSQYFRAVQVEITRQNALFLKNVMSVLIQFQLTKCAVWHLPQCLPLQKAFESAHISPALQVSPRAIAWSEEANLEHKSKLPQSGRKHSSV